MKKLFLLSVLALGAVTMSAKLNIEYVGTIPEYLNIDGDIDGVSGPYTDYVISTDTLGTNFVFNIYSLDNCSLVKSLTLSNQGCQHVYAYHCFKDFYTDDNKIGFIVNFFDGAGDISCLYNEDGECLKTFNGSVLLLPNRGFYYLFDLDDHTDIYKIQYKDPSNIESLTAPTRTSNARKVVENGQMYIILDGVKYAVTGSQTE